MKSFIFNLKLPILFVLLFEFTITGSLSGIALLLYFHHYDVSAIIFGILAFMILGLPGVVFNEYRQHIVRTHTKREKLYKIKNIFKITPQEMEHGVDYKKALKESNC